MKFSIPKKSRKEMGSKNDSGFCEYFARAKYEQTMNEFENQIKKAGIPYINEVTASTGLTFPMSCVWRNYGSWSRNEFTKKRVISTPVKCYNLFDDGYKPEDPSHAEDNCNLKGTVFFNIGAADGFHAEKSQHIPTTKDRARLFFIFYNPNCTGYGCRSLTQVVRNNAVININSKWVGHNDSFNSLFCMSDGIIGGADDTEHPLYARQFTALSSTYRSGRYDSNVYYIMTEEDENGVIDIEGFVEKIRNIFSIRKEVENRIQKNKNIKLLKKNKTNGVLSRLGEKYGFTVSESDGYNDKGFHLEKTHIICDEKGNKKFDMMTLIKLNEEDNKDAYNEVNYRVSIRWYEVGKSCSYDFGYPIKMSIGMGEEFENKLTIIIESALMMVDNYIKVVY